MQFGGISLLGNLVQGAKSRVAEFAPAALSAASGGATTASASAASSSSVKSSSAFQAGAAAAQQAEGLAQRNPVFATRLNDVKRTGGDVVGAMGPLVFVAASGVDKPAAASHARVAAEGLKNDPVYTRVAGQAAGLEKPPVMVVTLKDGDAKSGTTTSFGYNADNASGGVVAAEVNVSAGNSRLFSPAEGLKPALQQYGSVLSVAQGLETKKGLAELVAVTG